MYVDVHGTPEAYDETNEILSTTGVTKTNLMASLLAIVSLHNAPDALLNDLLKRDHLILGVKQFRLGLSRNSLKIFARSISPANRLLRTVS